MQVSVVQLEQLARLLLEAREPALQLTRLGGTLDGARQRQTQLVPLLAALTVVADESAKMRDYLAARLLSEESIAFRSQPRESCTCPKGGQVRFDTACPVHGVERDG